MLSDRKFKPGEQVQDKGFLTRIEAIGPRSGRDLELLLGFRSGRLEQGYSFSFLLDSLTTTDFEFAGTPMRSGGRLGLPASTIEADATREFISSTMIEKYGQRHYDQQRKQALSGGDYLFGPKRLCRINAVSSVPEKYDPSYEYPMGHSAGTQWYLCASKSFYIAAFVDSDAIAYLPDGQKVSISYRAPYENRHRFRIYLETARPGIMFRSQ